MVKTFFMPYAVIKKNNLIRLETVHRVDLFSVFGFIAVRCAIFYPHWSPVLHLNSH